MNEPRDRLRLVEVPAARTVPARRFGEVVEAKNRERKQRIEGEQKIACLSATLNQIVRNLPLDTRERLAGAGINGAADMSDVQLGGLLVRIDAIMSEGG